jgi:hypothetical protein
VRNQQTGHPRLVHPYAHAIAGDSRLGNLEKRATNAVLVPDAYLRIGQTLNSEILSELSEGKVRAAKLILPVLIRIHLVHEYRPVFASVARQVPLPVALDI